MTLSSSDWARQARQPAWNWPAEVRKRWPQLEPPDTFEAGLEKEAGIVFPETGITAFMVEAQKAGANLLFNEPVIRWSADGDRVRVLTAKRQFEAGCLLLSTGARIKHLLGDVGSPLSPKRVPVYWVVPPRKKEYRLGTFPVNFWQIPVADLADADGYRELCALPATHADGRVKVAFHNHLADCDPETTIQNVAAAEVEDVRALLGEYLPALAGCEIFSNVCLYTLTPDGDFYLGPVPGHANVLAVALACHGFKFAPALKEILADMLEGRPPAFDVRMFSPGRFL